MSRRLSTLLIGAVSTALVLALIPSGFAQTASKKVLSVKPSNLISEVSQRARRSPSLTPVELAAYGNDLIAKNGFEYHFDLCDILNHRRDQAYNGPADIVRNHQMTSTDGAKLTFKFTIDSPNEALCGECWSSIPSLQVTKKEMTLIAEGKRYRVRRPPSFILDEAQLVDQTLKKVLRTWQVPYQTVPAGISADGTRLYLYFYIEDDLDQLVLEVSENGPPQFRDRAVMQSSEGKILENYPQDPNNSYLAFMSFRVAEKTYLIKFIAPCT